MSSLLAGLLLVSSLVGLLYGSGGFYESYPAGLAGLVGQDLVTLVVGMMAGALLLLVPYLRGIKEVGREPGSVKRGVEGGL